MAIRAVASGPGSVGSRIGGSGPVIFASPTGASNDVNPTGFGPGVGRLDVTLAAGVANWTGLAAGVDGQLLIISNQDATNSLTLNRENAGSAAANRFSGAADPVLAPGASARLMYYGGTINRWRII